MTERQRELYDQVNNASEKLVLHKKQIDDAGARAIAEAFKVNTTLKELDLYQNQIGDAGLQAVAEALKVNTTLTSLDLEENRLGDAGAHAIAEALKVNKTLDWLNLNKNQIGDAGAQAIAEALKVNTTLSSLHLGDNQIGDIGAQAIAGALMVNKQLWWLDIRFNFIGKAGLQAIGEARQVNRTLNRLLIDTQINPLVFSSRPRLATAEDLQNVFHLLSSGLALEDQPTSLPALPAEIAELIMDEAHYWQGVQHTKRSHFYDSPERILKVTLPQRIDGGSVRVKAIQVFRDMGNRFDSNGSSGFDLIIRNEQGAVQYEFSAKPTFVNSSLELVTILPANHPVIRQMRAGWQVQVRASKSSRDVQFESLYVGYV
ncbi:hypothetical protein CAOG_07638 [Capsaspora owczarzaki ATCC 30864]|uniref:NOD3 protein n=1 Tax=Capsaspora owczarzaki (strain ATCC 30864) TaxID=595528 RepID=A0A0D2UQB6_CAPO3|nr:hypothetical protein CAOG_07638 [Capsaspora owczarzaki ATCC 30864]KJE97191.1 hypothetical protein CAOG_007638 [Capsaspora owczarzaki ATCC 30864]|eukprot:XP_004343512.2 hypothetical protein CAOG_07638 [Capsaspora owczarzaki ATCC 30864]